MALRDVHPVGNVWVCQNDWFIRPQGSVGDRLDRLPTKKVLLFLVGLIIALPGAGFYIFGNLNYPDGPKIFQGVEYRCGEQYDRERCADVPIYLEDESGQDYPAWVEVVDDNVLLALAVVVALIIIVVQGQRLWNWWIWMGGTGPLGKRAHRHRCPECEAKWGDEEPNCPGLVEFECPQCWGQALASGNAQDDDRNQSRFYTNRSLWYNRKGNTGITRLYRLHWGSSPGRLARNHFGGISQTVWSRLSLALGAIALFLLFVGVR